MRPHSICSIIFLGVPAFLSVFAQQHDSQSAAIVTRQTLVMTKPPTHVPSGTVVDGPILGNGDVGVAIGGPPEDLRFYIGKNDFWSQQASPMTVGGVQLSIPALNGATYREEQDLFHAEVRGTFAKAGTIVKTTSWVAATENLFVTELQADGGSKVTIHAKLFPERTSIHNNDKPINIGREQHGRGRWYFTGLIDEVHLYDRALDQGEVSRLMNFDDPAKGLLRRWDFEADEGTTLQDTKTKRVSGPPCPKPPSVYRPDERPMDKLGCEPDGYHLDYQPYGIGRHGRAVKLMHSVSYLDAGQVPAVQQVSLAAWVYIFSAGDANYILSKGDWNDAYSLSLDQGRLRFSVGERFVRSDDALPTNHWVHVAGTFDGIALRAYVGGHEVLPRARFIAGGNTPDTIWISRNADGPLDQQYAWPSPLAPTSTPLMKGREVSFAERVVGAKSVVQDGALDFTLTPGKPVYLVMPILSDIDAPDHQTAVKTRAEAMTSHDVIEVSAAHREWWRRYWAQSFVTIDDPVLEKAYYASQYITASASRSGKVAPGLYGPWVTTDHPSWNGDYTLDYNYQTPLLALYSSNHISITDSYEPPILDFLVRGREYARTMLNARGVYYPGHIGPWGLERSFDYDPFMGMKGNAAFVAMPMLMRFYSTYDDAYAHKIYPFLSEVGNFWEDYLVKKDGRYIIHDDCANEVGPWSSQADWTKCPEDLNPMVDLAFVRATFQGLIDISQELGTDAERRPMWQEILDHLSAYPTAQQAGKTVFRSAEDSEDTMRGWGSRAIWPANQIGLGKDAKLLAIARNTFDVDGYSDHPLGPPAMARVGYDPTKLLADLRKNCLDACYSNGYLFFFGGGVESSSTIPSTINEMLLQSFSGVLRLFPDWPRDRQASFSNLRAYGAFLVSSSFKDDRVTDLSIVSEKGRECTLANPWPRKALVLYRNGSKAETLSGSTVAFRTTPGESISLRAE
jgi:alpha-L-fucosidase 2